LGLAGFRPELFRCVGQHDGLTPLRADGAEGDRRPFGLDPERGGALCPDCYNARKQERDVRPLSPNALRFLQTCQRSSFTALASRAIPPSLHREAERLMQHYVTYHLEQDVKAGAFLQQIRQRQR
jgi:recombinational DNA repair protein (RecF pathway)